MFIIRIKSLYKWTKIGTWLRKLKVQFALYFQVWITRFENESFTFICIVIFLSFLVIVLHIKSWNRCFFYKSCTHKCTHHFFWHLGAVNVYINSLQQTFVYILNTTRGLYFGCCWYQNDATQISLYSYLYYLFLYVQLVLS